MYNAMAEESDNQVPRAVNNLYIICGLSFAGKTTAAHAIATQFGIQQVDVDWTKEQLFGPDIRDEELSREQWDTIYAETDACIVSSLDAGQAVIDASRNFSRTERAHIRTIVTEHGHRVVTIYVNTPEWMARQRWQANRANPTRRDVTDADFEAIVRAWEAPLEDEQALVLPFDEPIERWIEAHADIFVEVS